MKILVAMSGGVDSTVVAYLLKNEGHEVLGVNFDFVGDQKVDELNEISSKLGINIIYRDYKNEFKNKIIKSFVCDYENGITPNPCAICNGIMKFEKLLEVMKEVNYDMVATGHYANVAKIGARATRPYCRHELNECDISESVGASSTSANDMARATRPYDIGTNEFHYCIKKSLNQQKDQSYMLYRLSQEQLSHIIFPLADMDKSCVRSIAAKLGLTVANKKDSQDVCFINEENGNFSYQEFIKKYEFGNDYKEKIAKGILKESEIASKKYFAKGQFVDKNGKVLGYHNGIINYTVGQRKGLNIAFGERKFVLKIDSKENKVVLGSNDDLMSTDFKIRDVVFSGISREDFLLNVVGTNKIFYAKLRYRHDGTACNFVSVSEFVGENSGARETRPYDSPTKGLVQLARTVGASSTSANEGARATRPYDVGASSTSAGKLIYTCKLLSPVRAITPGQSAVFYDENDNVMFGGIIL